MKANNFYKIAFPSRKMKIKQNIIIVIHIIINKATLLSQKLNNQAF